MSTALRPGHDLLTRPQLACTGLTAATAHTPLSCVIRARMMLAVAVFAVAFGGVGLKLASLSMDVGGQEPRLATAATTGAPVLRGDILDRRGRVLATTVPTAHLYARPHKIRDPEAATKALTAVLPELDAQRVAALLGGPGRFVYLKRHLTPRQQSAVNALGIPGLAFEHDVRRVYPSGALTAHTLGMVDVDNHGIAGLEHGMDATLAAGKPVRATLDLSVQAAVHEELAAAMTTFKAKAAAAVVLEVPTGAVRAMVSLPDFDPHEPGDATAEALFNRASLGVYELGSVFKVVDAALALESGVVDLSSKLDAREPLRLANFTIRDHRPQKRSLSLSEVMIHSSNIGAARMALAAGTEAQRLFLDRLGLLAPLDLEVPERGRPLAPSPWREINTATIAFGHGIAVTPLHLASAVGALVSDGRVIRPSLVREDHARAAAPVVVSADTVEKTRFLMRQVVQQGSGKNAAVAGLDVGGKTGSAEKLKDGGYDRDTLRTSFVAAFPMHAPRYVVLAVLDEPQGSADTFGFATAGWNAAPTVGRMIARIAPSLGVSPRHAPDTFTDTHLVHAAAPQRSTPGPAVALRGSWSGP